MNTTKAIAAAVICVALAGCAHDIPATSEPIMETHDVAVAVQVPCLKKIEDVTAKRPTFPDTTEALQAAPDIYEATKLYKAGRKLRIGWESLLEEALAACAAQPKSQPTN